VVMFVKGVGYGGGVLGGGGGKVALAGVVMLV
jgi:hypothetical protein